MTVRYIYPLSSGRPPKNIGSKAMNLHFLICHQYMVPRSWVVPWTAYEEGLAERSPVLEQLRADLNRIVNPRISYAVRSSASVKVPGIFHAPAVRAARTPMLSAIHYE